MKIPSFINMKIVDEKGYLTDPWAQVFMLLLQQLQVNFSDEGVVIPSQTTANVTRIQNSSTCQVGTLLFNSTTGKLQVKLADNTFHDIVTL